MLVAMLPTPVLAGNETDVCHIVHTEADDPGEGAIDTLPEVTEVSAAEVTEESTGEAAEKPTVETTVETTQVSADEATEAAEKLPGVSAKADPQTQAYQGNATWTGSYLNRTDGVTWTTETASDVHVITSSDTTWSSGWYVVTGDVSITGNNGKGAVIVNGDVKLILADGASLTVDGGINVSSGNTLTIYAQSTGDNMGKLTSSATSRAGIGANWDSTAGTMVFNGGRLSFTGANGINTGNGVLIVNGGVVDAVSNGNGDAAIGGEGWNNGAGSITINGGTVTATATAEDLYGIGFFVMCDDMNSTLTINGGVLIMDTIHAAIYSGVAVTLGRDSALKVTAGEKADIASAVEYSQRGDTSFWRENYVKVEPCVSHTIMTGSVSYYDTQYHTDGFCRWCGAGTPIPHSYDETTGLCACGAWSGTYLDCDKDGRNWVTRSTSGVQQFDTKSYTLTGGWYVAVGEVTFSNSAEVGGDLKLILADGANLTFSQGFTVTEENSLTIYAQSTGERMGKLNATGIGSYGAAIGGCGDHNCGTVTINGGMINAKGGGYTPAIGGGDRSDAGIVTINGGVINAEGGKCAPGIGGGAEYEGTNAAGTITINGGTVVAKGRDGACGIGSGYYYIRYGTRPRYVGGSGGTVTINGGSVTAVGGITDDTTSVNYRAPQAFDTAPTLNQNVG